MGNEPDSFAPEDKPGEMVSTGQFVGTSRQRVSGIKYAFDIAGTTSAIG